MTTLVWKDNRVYADSRFFKDKELFEALNKINAFTRPIPFLHNHDGKNIVDFLHGWFYTGALKPAEALIMGLESGSDMMARFIETYMRAQAIGLANFENLFELILIGERANYSIRVEPRTAWDSIDPPEIFKIEPHSAGIVLGSGAEIMTDLFRRHGKNVDVVRAMYHVMSQDKLTGGMIDVWELRRANDGRRRYVFERIGLCRGLEDRDVNKLTRNLKTPYPFDWTLNPAAPPVTPKKPAKAIMLSREIDREDKRRLKEAETLNRKNEKMAEEIEKSLKQQEIARGKDKPGGTGQDEHRAVAKRIARRAVGGKVGPARRANPAAADGSQSADAGRSDRPRKGAGRVAARPAGQAGRRAAPGRRVRTAQGPR